MSFYIRKNMVLSLLWGLWVAALVAYAIYDLFFYLFIVPALFLIFTVSNVMFKKKVNSNNDGSSSVNIPSQTSMPLSNASQENAKNNTIIAAGTQLKGSIVKGSNFSIKKGGIFVGQSEITEEPVSQVKSKAKPVIAISQDKAKAEDVAAGQHSSNVS